MNREKAKVKIPGMLLIISLIFVVFLTSASVAAEKDFVVSFGNGGFSSYRVVDNACYVFTLNYPADERQLSQLMNEVITASVLAARKQYARDNDGFINVKVQWQFLGKERIVYQVCGDIVKRGGK